MSFQPVVVCLLVVARYTTLLCIVQMINSAHWQIDRQQ